ncbi:MAG: phosphatidylserine/phosphatidylglycerophosphate/cardiolipin synthase family protein, partial [Elusimicrobia bacterium]|nr:phosphatidylserine/phosphatidylglycerophosphate/cardiolipin synthase family protein [Elusimicrobiota bacterium]
RVDGVKVTDVSHLWETMVRRFVDEYVPKEKLAGIMLTARPKDMVLYRNDEGELHITAFNNMPSGITITRTINEKYFTSQAVVSIKKELQRKYPGQTKFIFRLKNMPRASYIYVDISKNAALEVYLPMEWEFSRGLLPLGFELKMMYSFFIQSHLIEFIKAPFTSTHRLLSRTGLFLRGLLPDISRSTPYIPAGPDGFMDLDEFNNFLDARISRRVYKGSIELLVGGEEFFTHFIQSVANARRSISIRIYIFNTDPFAMRLADLLKRRSNEGVNVRVMLDDLNIVLNRLRTPKLLSAHHTMTSIRRYLTEDSRVSVRTQANTWMHVAHQKVIIIDDEIAYTGGMNITESQRYFWHDIMVALRGPVVLRLQDDFNHAWAFAGTGGDFHAGIRRLSRRRPRYKGSTEGMKNIRILYTTPSSREILNAQLAAIRSARKRIYITTPYFSSNAILRELIQARQRGVDVRVIIPRDNNVAVMHTSNLIKANAMIRNDIRVFMYQGMTHTKAALFDNWACLGSGNLDNYSLNFNQEMNIAVSCEKFAKELYTRLFAIDFESSYEVTTPFEISWLSYITNALSPM